MWWTLACEWLIRYAGLWLVIPELLGSCFDGLGELDGWLGLGWLGLVIA